VSRPRLVRLFRWPDALLETAESSLDVTQSIGAGRSLLDADRDQPIEPSADGIEPFIDPIEPISDALEAAVHSIREIDENLRNLNDGALEVGYVALHSLETSHDSRRFCHAFLGRSVTFSVASESSSSGAQAAT
jgi:hypothetical protein